MAAFVYKFKTVKKVKEQLKKKIEKELAEVELEISDAGNKMNDLHKELIYIKESLSSSNMKISEIQFRNSSETIIKNKLDDVKKEIEKLQKKKLVVISELEKKSKEHKMFDILEDNMRAQFTTDQNKIENEQINELAVQKFARNQL